MSQYSKNELIEKLEKFNDELVKAENEKNKKIEFLRNEIQKYETFKENSISAIMKEKQKKKDVQPFSFKFPKILVLVLVFFISLTFIEAFGLIPKIKHDAVLANPNFVFNLERLKTFIVTIFAVDIVEIIYILSIIGIFYIFYMGFVEKTNLDGIKKVIVMIGVDFIFSMIYLPILDLIFGIQFTYVNRNLVDHSLLPVLICLVIAAFCCPIFTLISFIMQKINYKKGIPLQMKEIEEDFIKECEKHNLEIKALEDNRHPTINYFDEVIKEYTDELENITIEQLIDEEILNEMKELLPVEYHHSQMIVIMLYSLKKGKSETLDDCINYCNEHYV